MESGLQNFILKLVNTIFSDNISISNLKNSIELTSKFLGSECVWINLFKENTASKLFLEFNLPQDLKEIEIKLHKDCQCISFLDNKKDFDFFFSKDCKILNKVGISKNNLLGHLSIPLWYKDELLATINFGFCKKTDFNSEVIKFISKVFSSALYNYIFLKKMEEKDRELNKKNKDLEILVTAISHDMKTPIITTKGFLNLIEKKYARKMTKEQRNYLNNIKKGVLRIEELVKDLLNLKQTEKLLNIKEVINVGDSLKSSLRYIKPLIRDRLPKIKITGKAPKLLGNNIAFFQIFTNLLANSIKYTPDDRNPNVNIAFSEDENYHIISIKDNGIGMTEKEIKEAFKPFNKVKTLEREGSGVGLSIVKRLVEGFGGIIKVESQKNIGSNFIIYWPKRDSEEIFYAEGEIRTRTGLTPLDPESSVSASSTTSA